MNNVFRTKLNDISRPLHFTIRSEGKTVDLTGRTVKIKMYRSVDETLKINLAACVVAADQVNQRGEGDYYWIASDLNERGDFWVELVEYPASGSPTTHPRDEHDPYGIVKVI